MLLQTAWEQATGKGWGPGVAGAVYTDRSYHSIAPNLYALPPTGQPNAACMHASGAPSSACELRWTLGTMADVEAVVVRLLLVLPRLLCLPWHTILLNERPVDGGLNELCRRDRYPIELAEACDQCFKFQCHIRLLWVHWVSQRCNTYKLVDDIRDKLCYMNNDLGQDSIDQLAFRQQEIKIMVTGKDVAEQKCHPDLSQSGHANAHDPHRLPVTLHAK